LGDRGDFLPADARRRRAAGPAHAGGRTGPAHHHDQSGHLHLPDHLPDRLEGRGLGHDHLPGGAGGGEPEPARGGRGRRGGPVAAAAARHPARYPAGERVAADPAAGGLAHGRFCAVHPATQRGGSGRRGGVGHLRLLPRSDHAAVRGRCRGRVVQGRGRTHAGADRQQGRAQARRARDLLEDMTSHTAAPITPRRTGLRANRPVWEEKPTAIGQTGKAALLTFVVFAVLIPMWVVVVTSLSSRATINEAGGLVIIPRGLDFSAYVAIVPGGRGTRALGVGAIIAVGGPALSLVATVLAP